MKEPKTIPAATQAKIVAELHRTFRHLHQIEGCSVAEILIVIHSEAIAQIAGIFGGSAAADCAAMAAHSVSHLPRHPHYATVDCVGGVQ